MSEGGHARHRGDAVRIRRGGGASADAGASHRAPTRTHGHFSEPKSTPSAGGRNAHAVRQSRSRDPAGREGVYRAPANVGADGRGGGSGGGGFGGGRDLRAARARACGDVSLSLSLSLSVIPPREADSTVRAAAATALAGGPRATMASSAL